MRWLDVCLGEGLSAGSSIRYTVSDICMPLMCWRML